MRDIGRMAMWSVSSAKPGNGVDKLLNDDNSTYWQSDGGPLHVNVQFLKKMRVQEVAIYLDFKLDESYTPMDISIWVGTSYADLHRIAVRKLNEPTGWVTVTLASEGMPFVRANVLRLSVEANHQCGRDCHIRQMRLFGPRQPFTASFNLPTFSTVDFSSLAVLR